MAYYYKISDDETVTSPLEGIKVYEENSTDSSGPSITYDFSKHVLIELLDNVTPEAKLWNELGLTNDKDIIHKRMIVDPHRVNCRRAIVVCSSSDKAKELAQRLSQVKIIRRSICAVVVEALLSDICLFEKQIIQYGDKRSQHQLVYVTELTRHREPSGLAQYLRDKFSPFGTILSVLVSEDKDGYAYPEAVIKFAHLSEAFAAELAYDQCAVALERLSVTTHHNILLSQCDLRARLREAYSKRSSEFSFYVSPESQIKDKSSKETDSDQTKILSSRNFEISVDIEKNNESVLNDSNSTLNGNNEFPSDSAELADVLKMPCEPSNLIDCLQGIAECSESSISRRSGNSLAETEPRSIDPLNLTDASTPLNKTWSTRIMGWITDLPNMDPSSQVDGLKNDGSVPENVTVSEPVVVTDKSEHLGSNQQSKPTNPSDVVSNTGSYITCANDLNSSFNSLTASGSDVGDSNNVTMVEDKTVSHDSEYNDNDATNEEASNINNSSICESPAFKSNGFPALSLKRKNSSMLTEKLSLRNKRINSSQSDPISEGLDGETTLPLQSVPQTKSCSVVLNSFPALNELAKNLTLTRKPVVVLERLNPSQYTDGNLKIDQTNEFHVKNKAKNKKHSKKRVEDDCSSVSSQSVRRSSRLTSRGSDNRSLNVSNPSLENGTKSLTSSTKLVDRKEKPLNEMESPLRLWLKKELESSKNNHVTRSEESTKRIVCATTDKDVLISVGCSHMTCDFCYPNSVKLLLGFH